MRNVAARMRKTDNPYATWQAPNPFGDGGTWTYRLLKSWQAKNDKPYARWLVAVNGYGNDIGDTYVNDLRMGIVYAASTGNLIIDQSVWTTVGEFVAWAFNEE